MINFLGIYLYPHIALLTRCYRFATTHSEEQACCLLPRIRQRLWPRIRVLIHRERDAVMAHQGLHRHNLQHI